MDSVYDLLHHSDMDDPFPDNFDHALDINDIIGASPLVLKTEPDQTASNSNKALDSPHSDNMSQHSGQEQMDTQDHDDEFGPEDHLMDSGSQCDNDPYETDDSHSVEESEFAAEIQPNSICKQEIDLNDYMDGEKTPPRATVYEHLTAPSSGHMKRYRSSDLEHIMFDHNYSNQPEDSLEPGYLDEPLVDASSLTLNELLDRVQSKLEEGSPVYDARLDLLSLVTSLVNDKVDMNEDLIKSLDDKVRVMKISVNSSKSVESSQVIEALRPDTKDVNVQTDEIISEGTPNKPETNEKQLESNEDLDKSDADQNESKEEQHQSSDDYLLDDGVKGCLTRFRQFGQSLADRNSQLIYELKDLPDTDNHVPVFSAFLGSLEASFRELVKEFKSVAKLPVDRVKNERLNAKSKERWMAMSSSEDEDSNEPTGSHSQPSSPGSKYRKQTCRPTAEIPISSTPIPSLDNEEVDNIMQKEQELNQSVRSLDEIIEDYDGIIGGDKTVEGRQNTLSGEWMEKLVYDTDSENSIADEPNDAYDNYDEPLDYPALEPITDELDHLTEKVLTSAGVKIEAVPETTESSVNEKPVAVAPHPVMPNEVNGMSDEEFFGFAEDIALKPAQPIEPVNQTNDAPRDAPNSLDETASHEAYIENAEDLLGSKEVDQVPSISNVKQEEPLDIGSSQVNDVSDVGLDHLLNSENDKDFSFDGEFFLDSVCDDQNTSGLLDDEHSFEMGQIDDETEALDHESLHETFKNSDTKNETPVVSNGDDGELDTTEPIGIKEEHLTKTISDLPELNIEENLTELPTVISKSEEQEKQTVRDDHEDLPERDDRPTEDPPVDEKPKILNNHPPRQNEQIDELFESIEPPNQNETLDQETVEKREYNSSTPVLDENSSSHESGFMMPVEVQMDDDDDDDELINIPNEVNGMHLGKDDDMEMVGDDERAIDRLLDFSSLNVRKRATDGSYYVPLKKPEPVKQVKPTNASLIDEIAQAMSDSAASNENLDSTSEADEDKQTEEQFLKECNIKTKEKLLMMSSDSEDDEHGSKHSLSGKESETLEDDDSGDEENSKDSAIDKFLKGKINEEMEESLKIVKNGELIPQSNVDEEDDKQELENDLVEIAKKDRDMNEKHDASVEQIKEADDTPDILPSKIDFDETDDSSEEDPKTTSKLSKQDKHILGKGIFSGLDGKKEPVIDIKEIEAISERSSLSSDCELLDTSMFKTASADKKIDDKKLSRMMKNSRKAAAAKAAQPAEDCISLSSDTDLDLDEEVVEVPDDTVETKEGSQADKNRGPRRMLRADQLADATKSAQTEEKERVKRLEKKSERLAQILAKDPKDKSAANEEISVKSGLEESDIVLDFDTKTKTRITVHPDIVKHLKPHQVDGVKFMYDSCYGSVDDKHSGSGCILAHCMGLGKTLQLIALLHTLIRHTQLKTNKILVICPKSTVMNWAEEIERWLGPVRGGPSVKVYQFPDSSDINEKLKVLKSWQNSGKSGYSKAGCLLIGYEAFRTLVFYHLTKKRKASMAKDQLDAIKRKVEETLLKPGADIVICDEGHMIKNRKSATSLAVNEIKTRKRIILTGTPIQNNLKEYYSMVNFIKPSFLGTEKEFANLYANPIRIGQHKDSSKGEIKFMKQRSYVLHKKLSKFVQRREAALLKTFLPEKYEYVLFIPMTDVQNRLYVHFLENNPLKDKYGGKSLIPDYTFLRKIWTHPKVLESAYKNALLLLRKKESKTPKPVVDSEDEQPDDVLDSQTGNMSVTSDWWRQFVTPDDLETVLPSNKLRTLLEILQMCQENGEKCLVFSAFVAVLDVVEYFMKQINDQMNTSRVPGLERYSGPWIMTKDYYRLDGKTPKSIRHAMITRFNDPANTRTRCFLISAKAGGQGINLIGANRVILLDTSWNPSNDQQNIFRVFRLGQKNKCYIYRLLAMGTMEEKVYSRSVTKQAMSFRVVDEQQIDRHYSMAELAELYTLTIPDYTERPTPVRPYDNVLANLLHNYSELVYKYHEHDSLLERNSEQDLSEEEKADAWAAYEKDVSLKNQYGNMPHLPGAENLFNQNPYGAMNMAGYPQMNSFPQYGYPNATMMNNFLNSMGPYGSSNSAMEKELMLLSQMYNSPYASILASTARGGSSGQYPYGSLPASAYGSPIMPSLGSGAPSPYTPTTSGMGASSSMYGTGAYSSSAHQQNIMSGLNNYLPNFSKSPGSMNNLPPSMPGPSTSRVALPAHQPSALRDIDKEVWSYLTNSSSMFGKDDLISAPIGPLPFPNNNPVNQNVAPGPNAMKNPLLFKELSIPCAEPIPSGSGLSLPSIPTSVITSVGPSRDSPRLQNVRDNTQPLPSSKSSPTQMNLNIANKDQTIGSKAITSTVTSTSITTSHVVAANKDLVRTAATPPNRRSPLTATKVTPLPTTTNNTPAVISFSSNSANRTSPEPHLIVKNVSAINQSIKAGTPPTTNKSQPTTVAQKAPTAQPIKNFNMGIVYPSTKNPSAKFDLNQNDTILRAAQSQLNALASKNISATSGTTSTTANLSSLQPKPRVTLSTAPISNPSLVNKSRVIRTTPLATATAGNRIVRRVINEAPTSSTGLPTKNNEPTTIRAHADAAPNVVVSNATKRWSNQSGLTISPIPNTNNVAYKNSTAASNTMKNPPAAIHKPNIYTAAAQNLLKNKIPPNKLATINATQFRQSPATSVAGNLVRQNTAPTIATNSGNAGQPIQTRTSMGPANMIQSTNNGNTIIRQQQQQQQQLSQTRPLPPLVRQNTAPSSVILSNAALKNITTTGTASPTGSPTANIGRPMMNRNVTVRRIGAPLGKTLTSASTTVVSNPLRTTVGTTPTPASILQRTLATNPGMAKVTQIRGQMINRTTQPQGGLPVKPTTVTSAVRMPQSSNIGDAMVRRIVINPATSTRTTNSGSATPMTSRNIQMRPAGSQIINTTNALPTNSANAAGAKVIMSSQAMLQQQRKRKAAADQLPSVSITEIKKARMVSSPIQKVAAKNNSPATQGIRPPALDEITIVPRTITAATRRAPKTKATNSMEIVHLD